MQYRKMGSLDWKVSALGFGAMRLPIQRPSMEIDYEKASEMLRYAIDNGVNYVDTAWLYHDGKSESFIGKALNDGYRQKVKLVTKCPVWLIEYTNDFYKFFNIQIEKLDTEFIDIYLFHGLNLEKWKKIKKLGLIKEAEKLKLSGKIKHIGFSFHDSYETFKEIIDSYNWDATLVQYNYLDSNFEVTVKGVDYAASKNIAVIVMEPLRGGKLAQPSKEINEIIEKSPVKKTLAELALRYVWNHPGVSCVLSGMTNPDQVKENIKYAEHALPGSLSDDELKIIEQLKETYSKKIRIPCTNCRYCTPCPQGVDISENFYLLNSAVWEGEAKGWMRRWYNELGDDSVTTDWHGKGRASLCIECGECLEKCPQKINIPDVLGEVRQVYEDDYEVNNLRN